MNVDHWEYCCIHHGFRLKLITAQLSIDYLEWEKTLCEEHIELFTDPILAEYDEDQDELRRWQTRYVRVCRTLFALAKELPISGVDHDGYAVLEDSEEVLFRLSSSPELQRYL